MLTPSSMSNVDFFTATCWMEKKACLRLQSSFTLFSRPFCFQLSYRLIVFNSREPLSLQILVAKWRWGTNADELGASCLSLYALLASSDHCGPQISAAALVLPTVIFRILCYSKFLCVRVVDTRFLWHWILVICIFICLKLAKNWTFYFTPPSFTAFSVKWLSCLQPHGTREGVRVTTVVSIESYIFKGLRAW